MVKCVKFAYPHGEKTEVEIDLSSKADGLTEHLGYSKTFVGQYDEEPRNSSIVLITTKPGEAPGPVETNRTPHSPKSIDLPEPFKQEKVCNDVFFIRMETSSETGMTSPRDFTLHDFEKLA